MFTQLTALRPCPQCAVPAPRLRASPPRFDSKRQRIREAIVFSFRNGSRLRQEVYYIDFPWLVTSITLTEVIFSSTKRICCDGSSWAHAMRRLAGGSRSHFSQDVARAAALGGPSGRPVLGALYHEHLNVAVLFCTSPGTTATADCKVPSAVPGSTLRLRLPPPSDLLLFVPANGILTPSL